MNTEYKGIENFYSISQLNKRESFDGINHKTELMCQSCKNWFDEKEIKPTHLQFTRKILVLCNKCSQEYSCECEHCNEVSQ